MIREGDMFKNYKEICKAMREVPLEGNSKKAQLRSWETRFRWHNEGHKYVIDEVYKKRKKKVDDRGGNHAGNIELFMPYVVCLLLRAPMHDEWYGTQRFFKDLFQLVPHDIYEQINNEELSKEKFCEVYRIKNYNYFIDFVHTYELVAKDTIERCLKRLQKEGCLKFSNGYMFKIGENNSRFVCLSAYDDEIGKIERSVCKKLSDRRGYENVKGKQILRYIRHSPGEMKEYYRECLNRVQRVKKITAALKIIYEEEHTGAVFEPSMLKGYYRGFHITDKQAFILVGKAPPGCKSYQEHADKLRETIVENIFERMKKRVQIPECDFKNLKTLFLALHDISH